MVYRMEQMVTVQENLGSTAATAKCFSLSGTIIERCPFLALPSSIIAILDMSSMGKRRLSARLGTKNSYCHVQRTAEEKEH